MLEPCSVLTLRHPNLFFFTLHWITLRDTNKQILSIYTTGRRYRPSLRQCAVAWSNYLSWSEPRLPCVCRQFGVFLLAMTASTSLPITRRRIGSSTGSRHRLCYVQGRLLQYAVGRSTKVCYRQVAAGHERCSASCERHEEVRPWLDTPASLWAALARCGRSSHIQAWGDGVQVLAWPGTGLSAWAVHTGRSSCWTTASSFRQPPCNSLLHGFSSIRTAVAPSLSLDQRHGTSSKTICVSRKCKLTVFVVHWRRFFFISTWHIERIRGVFLRRCAIYIDIYITLHYKCVVRDRTPKFGVISLTLIILILTVTQSQP